MDFNEQFIKMMERTRSNSRAASTSTPRQEAREWSLDKNGVVVSKPIERESKAGSSTTTSTQEDRTITEMVNGVLISKPAVSITSSSTTQRVEKVKEIADFIATH